MATRRISTSITTATGRWTTSTVTAASRSTTRASFLPPSSASRPLIPSSSAGQASTRPRPGTDLSFISTRADTAHAGRELQEDDVADQEKESGAIAVADERDLESRNGKPERDRDRDAIK